MKSLLTFSTLLLTASASQAALFIEVGAHTLLANTPNQPITVSVTGGDPVPGLNLFAQVAPGGPTITSADLKTGTIFALIPDLQINDPSPDPRVVSANIFISAPGGFAPGNGPIATLVFDTTGIAPGTYALNLSNVLPDLGPFSTNFADLGIPVTILNGSLTIEVPEPASLSLLFLPLLALRLRRRPA